MIRSLLIGLFLVQASAGEAAPPVPPPSHWISVQSTHWCSLLRVADGRDAPLLEIREIAPSEPLQFLFPMPRVYFDRVDGPVVMLQPSGEVVPARGGTGRISRNGHGWDAFQASTSLPESLAPLLISASAVALNDRHGTIDRVEATNMAPALTALTRCTDGLLAKWGFDLAAYRALAEPPQAIDRGRWFSENDYPNGAIYESPSGHTIALVSIDETGKVTDCRLVARSTSDQLNYQTCKRLRASAHYSPAKDRQGRAVRSQAIVPVSYELWIR
jgi:hypothetical protein